MVNKSFLERFICTTDFYRLWTFPNHCETYSDLYHSYNSPSSLSTYLFVFSFSVMIMNINSISVSVANRLNIVFVICKVVTMLTVIITGLVRIGQGLLFLCSRNSYLTVAWRSHTKFTNGICWYEREKREFPRMNFSRHNEKSLWCCSSILLWSMGVRRME